LYIVYAVCMFTFILRFSSVKVLCLFEQYWKHAGELAKVRIIL